MSKKRKISFAIILAYVHRYVMPICALWIPLLLCKTKKDVLFGTGIGLIAYAIYTLLGHKLRWTHIYCSYQNAYHQRMTPEHIRWSEIRKMDAYGVPLIFAVIGLASVLVYVLDI